MQYNLPNFRIDFRDWMKGNNLYDNYPNGGLKADEVGYNAFKYPGLLVAQPTLDETTITSNLKRVPVIAGRGAQNGGKMNFTVISSDDPEAAGTGYAYTVNGLTGEMVSFKSPSSGYVDPLVLTKVYQNGWSEMVETRNGVVVSHSNGLTQLFLSSTTDESFHTTTGIGTLTSSAPHPLAWFESFIYVGDDEDLHEVDPDGSTGTATVLTMPNRYTITSLQEHQGYLFIAATKYFTSTDAFTGVDRKYRNYKIRTELFTWDGYSESFIERFRIPDAVSVLLSDEDGRLYVWTHRQFGYFNGLTFVPLRDLDNVVYRHEVVKVKNGLMYSDGNKIIRYSSVLPGGERKFFVQEEYTLDVGSILTIIPDVVFVTLNGEASTSGRNLIIPSVDEGTSGTNRQFEFNTKNIRVAVKVRHVVVETDGLGASGVIKVEYKDSDGNTKTCGTFTYTDTKMADKKRWIFDVHGATATTQITPLITLSGTAKLKSVDYYYEQAVDVNNS